MSDDILNHDNRQYVSVLLGMLTLFAIMAYYVGYGRGGATGIWMAAAVAFLFWLIWDSWNSNNKFGISTTKAYKK